MATDSKPEKILKVTTDEKKSAKDLEAEIAASASAISELETVAGETVRKPRAKRTRKTSATKKEPTKKTPTKKATSATKKTTSKKTTKTSTAKKVVKAEKPEVKAKSTPKKSPSKPTKVVPNQDVRPAKPAPKAVKKAIVTSSSEDGPSAVKVTIKPKSTSTGAQKPEPSDDAPKIMNHKGKTIAPLGVAPPPDKQEEPKPKTETKPEPAKVITTKVQVKKPIHTPKPYEVIKNEPEEEPAPEPKLVERPVAVVTADPVAAKQAHKRTPHVARVYDTQTYHLPLSVDHHHRKAMFPLWAQILILLIGVASAVVGAVVFDIFDLN